MEGFQTFLAEHISAENEAMNKYSHDSLLVGREITVLRDQVTSLLHRGIPPPWKYLW